MMKVGENVLSGAKTISNGNIQREVIVISPWSVIDISYEDIVKSKMELLHIWDKK
jgi:hypothetical protein